MSVPPSHRAARLVAAAILLWIVVYVVHFLGVLIAAHGHVHFGLVGAELAGARVG